MGHFKEIKLLDSYHFKGTKDMFLLFQLINCRFEKCLCFNILQFLQNFYFIASE